MTPATSQEETLKDQELRKPPFLRRVRIRGYKSIAFCEVELKPLTILVGRNGSGKSNFLDALAFLRDAIEHGVLEAINLHGGIESIRCRTYPSNRIEFHVEVDYGGYPTSMKQASYSIELNIADPKRPSVENERLVIFDQTQNLKHSFNAGIGKVPSINFDKIRKDSGPPIGYISARNGDDHPFPELFNNYRPDRLLLGLFGSQPFVEVGTGLEDMEFYNFHPDSMRDLRKQSTIPQLAPDGHNLARAIEGLKEIEEERLTRIRDYLRVITSEVDNIEVEKYGAEFETVRFRMRNKPNSPPVHFIAENMSDGTLRVLAALVAVFQIWIPSGPSVVGIEEPETSLHPAAAGGAGRCHARSK